ncbi:hypothetical protein diail_3147 [Diaporthe ilicicola]|nr:hypothetical protein diail_3147 [Diaporthe ilicicola]
MLCDLNIATSGTQEFMSQGGRLMLIAHLVIFNCRNGSVETDVCHLGDHTEKQLPFQSGFYSLPSILESTFFILRKRSIPKPGPSQKVGLAEDGRRYAVVIISTSRDGEAELRPSRSIIPKSRQLTCSNFLRYWRRTLFCSNVGARLYHLQRRSGKIRWIKWQKSKWLKRVAVKYDSWTRSLPGRTSSLGRQHCFGSRTSLLRIHGGNRMMNSADVVSLYHPWTLAQDKKWERWCIFAFSESHEQQIRNYVCFSKRKGFAYLFLSL